MASLLVIYNLQLAHLDGTPMAGLNMNLTGGAVRPVTSRVIYRHDHLYLFLSRLYTAPYTTDLQLAHLDGTPMAGLDTNLTGGPVRPVTARVIHRHDRTKLPHRRPDRVGGVVITLITWKHTKQTCTIVGFTKVSV